MARSTHQTDYQVLLGLLQSSRASVGMTQSTLAGRLGNTQTFISKVERGERRIDVGEFVDFCCALDLDPVEVFRRYVAMRRPKRARSAV
jgi:transcriptional regulator with XRE-family HTH domain